MCAPLVVFGPPRPARAKTPAEATETLTEDTNFVRRPTKKHVRAVGTSLTIWARQKKAGPLSLSGALPTVRGPLAIRDPPNCQRPLIIRNPSEHQEPSDHQGPSD